MRRLLTLLCVGCVAGVVAAEPAETPGAARAGAVVELDLEVDLRHLSLREVEIVRLLIRAARIMDGLHREQVAGDGFYPADMSRLEFETWADPAAASPYTRIRRDPQGALESVPYHEAWPRELGHAARLLAQAGAITNDEALRSYLTLCARAFITGDYARADAAWQAPRNSELDILIGPIGSDADREYGLKAAFGAFLMVRDWDWGARLAQFMEFLPEVQRSLPVSARFKAEAPVVDAKPAVYNLVYQAGYGAAGDEHVRLQQGLRKLQLHNVLRARYDAVVLPVAAALVVPEQHRVLDFETFFLNAMLHDMAHGLGLRRTIDDRATVYAALREHADVIEEAKAEVLSLWMIDWLHAAGELPAGARMAHHAAFLAGLLHAVRGDADSATGQARLLLFNVLRDWGAIRRDAGTGRYRIEEAGMDQALEGLAAQLLTLQGSGDYEGAAALIADMVVTRPELRADLEQLDAAHIPSGVVLRHDEHLPGL